MSVPTFYILKLDSLTPDFYNEPLIDSLDEADDEASDDIDYDCD